jgi:hypothetical protein
MNSSLRYRALPLAESENCDESTPSISVELKDFGHTSPVEESALFEENRTEMTLLEHSNHGRSGASSVSTNCCRQLCVWLCCTKLGHFVTVIAASFFLLLLSSGLFIYFSCLPVPYTSHVLPLTSDPAAFNNTIKVFLVGDSLWSIPQVRLCDCAANVFSFKQSMFIL